MKKYILLTFISLVCFTSWVFGKTTNADDKQTDLLVLEEAVQQTDASITEWSLYARERLSISTEKGFTELVENMQQKYQHAKWSVEKKEDQMKYSAIIPSFFGTEKVTWILYTHDPSASYAIYELHGDFESTQQMKKASDYFHRELTTLFNQNPQIFSCIKGVFNDKLDNVLQKQVNHLVVNLEAEKIEEVSENEFYSLSSYSTHFNEAISLNKQQKMNMQLGLRETGLGLTTTFVIGTPILTTEY